MLADEARDPAPVPPGAPREETAVGLALPLVPHARLGDEPPLPTRLRGAIAEVDVLAVEAEALVEATEFVEHLAAQEQERAHHPVGLDRGRRAVVQQVVRPLPPLGIEEEPERRPAEQRRPECREATTRSLPGA